MSNISYRSFTVLWYAKKDKYLHKISMFTFTIFFSSLEIQIRCAQNRYTAVQTELKYPVKVKRICYIGVKQSLI